MCSQPAWWQAAAAQLRVTIRVGVGARVKASPNLRAMLQAVVKERATDSLTTLSTTRLVAGGRRVVEEGALAHAARAAHHQARHAPQLAWLGLGLGLG